MASGPAAVVYKHFENLTDPRINRGKNHDLLEMIFLALTATICGAQGWADVERFATSKRAWFRQFVRLKQGIPSHDTFGRVFSALDTGEFLTAMHAWVDTFAGSLRGQGVAIDGKTLRGSFDRAAGKSALHTITAFACGTRICLRRLLRVSGYSLQANRKTLEGKQHPDRDAQFLHISRRVKAFQHARQPVISVDTKKKEPLGKMKNPGCVYRRKGDPEKVTTHDFPDKKRGKAVPYGVYDLTHDEAGVSIGVSHDTAEFAVAAIRRWWQRLGRKRYPRATRLLMTADCGGSNSPRTRLWRWALQQFANETGVKIELCPYPPGTSKWNKIEHRLFCHITRNWQGVPLETFEIVVNLIGSTRTAEGLEVHAWLDEAQYQQNTSSIPATL